MESTAHLFKDNVTRALNDAHLQQALGHVRTKFIVKRQQAIDALPEHYRDAVLLSDVHEFRYAEIAEILGVPVGTAKSRLFRGRRILQRMLIRYAVEMGYVKPRAA